MSSTKILGVLLLLILSSSSVLTYKDLDAYKKQPEKLKQQKFQDIVIVRKDIKEYRGQYRIDACKWIRKGDLFVIYYYLILVEKKPDFGIYNIITFTGTIHSARYDVRKEPKEYQFFNYRIKSKESWSLTITQGIANKAKRKK
jgi:hypothetical protein